VASLAVPWAQGAEDSPRFEFRDGDRVVLLGDALIERDQKYGYLETFLTADNPEKSITFRNLGWSGDTVHGHARAGFGTPADGFARLKEHVLAQPPTVILIGYGMAESFDGEAGLSRFVEGYNRLLDTLAPTKARLILLSPIAHEDLGRPLPDPTEHNKSLKLYRDAIERIAKERGARFVDLFTPSLGARGLTANGIHLNSLSAWWLAVEVERSLGNRSVPPSHSVSIEIASSIEITRSHNRAQGARIAKVEFHEESVRFESTSLRLTLPRNPEASEFARSRASVLLRVEGLAHGQYQLKIDGKPIAKAPDDGWAKGVLLARSPDDDQVERLRATINEKNLLYFHRWRPQNETYLFGFRKHEQGNNAREIPLFDPLVAEKEKEIATLRVPVAHTYELSRQDEIR
jgi:hypothetical protein